MRCVWCCSCRAGGHPKASTGAPLFLRASDVKAATSAIAEHGFVVIKNALSPEQLKEVQQATFAASETVRLALGMRLKSIDCLTLTM